ncbi:hypothetical protein V3C33_04420 [Micrococcaceae bacterium Sec5.7]
MKEVDVARLTQQAKDLGELSEQLRQKQLTAARRRQEAILSLHAVGLSIRQIATQLGCSAAVVQASVRAAKARRPTIHRREERIPYELHVQLGLKLHEDDAAVRRIGREGIARMRRTPRSAIALEWISRWEQLLAAPVHVIESAMLEDTPFATELRQMSPFAGALSDDERVIAIRKASGLAPR